MQENNQDAAFGKYQLRKPALQNIGYMDSSGYWIGKNGINTTQDFQNNPDIQERMIRDYMKVLDRYNRNYGNYDVVGKTLRGVANDFNFSKSGILAAAHRRGAKEVANYIKALAKNANNQYYMPYDNFDIERQKELKQIETRLREFEK